MIAATLMQNKKQNNFKPKLTHLSVLLQILLLKVFSLLI